MVKNLRVVSRTSHRTEQPFGSTRPSPGPSSLPVRMRTDSVLSLSGTSKPPGVHSQIPVFTGSLQSHNPVTLHSPSPSVDTEPLRVPQSSKAPLIASAVAVWKLIARGDLL